MFKKFSPAAFGIPHLLVGALAAVALAACGGGTAGTPAQSTVLTSAATTPPPIVNGTPPTSVEAGLKYQYIPSASDPDGRPLSFDITNPPAWATFSTTTGELSGTPDASEAGMTGEIEIAVSDGTRRAIVGPFRIRIFPHKDRKPPPAAAPPTIAGTPAVTVTAGQPYSFTPTVSNPGGESLTFAIVNRPAWSSFNTATGALTGTPTSASVGAYANILLSVSGGDATVSLAVFAIQVLPATNDAPTISGAPAATVVAGAAYTFTPTATDPSGNPLTFSIANAPPWASFSASTGQLSGSPPTADVGTYSNIAITVSDGTLSASLPAFSIVVQAPANDTPTISGTPAASVVAGSFYSFKPSTTDPSGQILAFSIQGKPSWAAFSTSTGQLSGTPASADVGTFPGILISVSDGNESVSLPAFSIQVKAPQDHAPVIGGTPPASVVAGTAYMFTPTASDPDGNALTFSIANPPSWASFSSTTGQLSGTPARASVGNYSNIVISASDGTLATALPAFSIEVDAPVDQAPVISGTPPTHVVAGDAYAFTPTASDPDGNALTFSIANQPSWASFNSTTGQLSGTPASANVGTFANIVISVSDGTLAASLPAFAITVAAPIDPPPTISGSPATSVGAGNPYSFTPTTTDPSGNPLTFSIQNQPTWAAFNTHTGALSGTPGAGDAGSYANIVISVSDGAASATLASFSITVTQAASGSATLNWSAPTQNTNGTPLTNLAGFNIYYGTSAGNLNQTVHIANAGLTTYVLSNLAAGTWYFSINAYSTTGAESVVSNIVSKAIP